MRRLTWLLIVTNAFEAFRFGAGTFRALLDLPARDRLGPVAFAAFSRATDLSTRGIITYVAYGFGGLLLTGATWIVAVRARAPIAIRRLSAVACLASLAILAFTTQAAPLMFRVGSAPDDPAVLGPVLEQFAIWTNLRIACADLSFFCMLAALGRLALRQQESASS